MQDRRPIADTTQVSEGVSEGPYSSVQPTVLRCPKIRQGREKPWSLKFSDVNIIYQLLTVATMVARAAG